MNLKRCLPTPSSISVLGSLLIAACLSPALTGFSSDWPQWRGPALNGSSSAQSLPSELSLEKNLAWKSPLPGSSGSTPIIFGDKVFVSTVDAQKNLLLLALNRKTGAKLWERNLAIGSHSGARNNMSSPSPVADSERVIILFATGDLAAFSHDGKELWSRNIAKDYGKFSIMWIYGSSPLLHEGRLYIPVLQRNPLPADYTHAQDGRSERESYLLCLDPASGKNIWRHIRKTDSTLESQESYTTPIPHTGAGGRKEILVVGGDYVTGHDPKTGAEFWRARLYEKRDDWYRIVPSPVTDGARIYASGPKGQPLVAFKDGGRGDVTASHKAWSSREGHTDWSTPLLYQGKLFVLDGGKKTLTSMDPATGTIHWSGSFDVKEPIWSSPTGADNKIYLVSERGTVLVASAGSEFKLLSRLDLAEDPVRSSVAVAGNQVYVRTAKNLYCFANK
ncbi:MAG: hypothetical protein FJ405_06955 [Verrucomicrobia bacterium]|nr:hypothetical protein [Verrucomicrobiota bacterium]